MFTFELCVCDATKSVASLQQISISFPWASRLLNVAEDPTLQEKKKLFQDSTYPPVSVQNIAWASHGVPINEPPK